MYANLYTSNVLRVNTCTFIEQRFMHSDVSISNMLSTGSFYIIDYSCLSHLYGTSYSKTEKPASQFLLLIYLIIQFQYICTVFQIYEPTLTCQTVQSELYASSVTDSTQFQSHLGNILFHSIASVRLFHTFVNWIVLSDSSFNQSLGPLNS